MMARVAQPQTKQAAAIELLTQAAALVDPILSLGVRLAASLSPYNLIVTNVMGPSFPLYFLGAEMLEGYPMVPLFDFGDKCIEVSRLRDQLESR